MNKQVWALVGMVFLTACSSQPTETTTSSEPVVVSQPGDSKLSCDQLDSQTQSIEKDVKTLLAENEAKNNSTFTSTAIADMTLAVLSGGASANNRIDRSTLSNVNEKQKQQIQALAQRHNHLMVIAKEKDCSFVVATEARIERYKQQQQRPINNQTYRQRIGTN